MTVEFLSVLALVVGALYSSFGAAAIFLKGSGRFIGWLRASSAQRKLAKPKYIIIPTAAELAKYGSPVTIKRARRPSIYGTQHLLDMTNKRIEYIKLSMFVMYLVFAVRLVWLKIS